MIVVDSINNINSSSYLGIGLTIGNFDGMHMGHQTFIKRMIENCREENLLPVAMSFRPHPVMILRPQENFLINSYAERENLLERSNMDRLVEVGFNRDISSLAPGSFLDRFVFCNPRIKKLFLGFDFAFGANKSGGHSFISSYCSSKDVALELQQQYFIDSNPVSSTVVREKIRAGDVESARELLGRSFYLAGGIIKGDGRGRTLGFPTANIGDLVGRVVPFDGVYASYTHHKGIKYRSITNVGANPTFKSDGIVNVETHLFDFDIDVYGERLKVDFIKQIRSEKKFDSPEELVKQIEKDISVSKNILEQQ